MCAGAGQLGAEGRCARANGNTVLHRPQDGLVIVAAIQHILKDHCFCFGCGASGNSPQEGHSRCTGTNAIRREVIITRAGGDALLHCPVDRFLIVAALRHIDEYSCLGVAVCLHKDYLDGVIFRDILEGVGLHRAHALTIHQHLGYGVALVRGDGEGLIPSVTDGGPAGGRDRAVQTGDRPDGVVGVAATAATAATAADVGPVGVHSGVFIEYSSGRDLRAAACRGVPAVKAVSAAVGGGGQRGQLLIGGSHTADRGCAAVAVKGDGELGGDWCVGLMLVARHPNGHLLNFLCGLPRLCGAVVLHYELQTIGGLRREHLVHDTRVAAELVAVRGGNKGNGAFVHLIRIERGSC